MSKDDDICPVCLGSGEDVDGCGCSCIGEGKMDVHHNECFKPCCASCGGDGCGGSCPFCGGSGKKSDWKPGNPSYEGYELSTQKDVEP